MKEKSSRQSKNIRRTCLPSGYGSISTHSDIFANCASINTSIYIYIYPHASLSPSPSPSLSLLYLSPPLFITPLPPLFITLLLLLLQSVLITEALSKIPLLDGLTDAQLAKISECVEILPYPEGKCVREDAKISCAAYIFALS